MPPINSVCVFCGSSLGKHPEFRSAAEQLGKYLTLNNYRLVYGGANVGLMKILADTVLENGGKVTGVMPKHLVDKEVLHTGITDCRIVNDMSERKALMVKISDCFISLPGGFGTIDETAEVITYNQLRLIHKPLGFLNVSGFFDNLLIFFSNAVDKGFLRKEHYDNLIVEEDIETLFSRFRNYRAIEMDKWLRDIRNESGGA